MAQRTQSVLVYSIHVSQGSVATRFGCGGIFNGFDYSCFVRTRECKPGFVGPQIPGFYWRLL